MEINLINQLKVYLLGEKPASSNEPLREISKKEMAGIIDELRAYK